MFETKVTGLPPRGFAQSDHRRQFRNIVVGRMRRAMQRVVTRAQRNTKHAWLAALYKITQRTDGGTISVKVGNTSPWFHLIEGGSRKHWPPFGPGSRVAVWARAHSVAPFLVARSIATHDQPGRFMLAKAWAESQSDLDNTADEAVSVWLTRWAAYSSAE